MALITVAEKSEGDGVQICRLGAHDCRTGVLQSDCAEGESLT